MNSSRTYRGSRMSRNSESDGSFFADSDDEIVPACRVTKRATKSAKCWKAFESSDKCIGNENPEDFTKSPKKHFVSSGTFQKVMVDMYGDPEYSNTKGHTLLKMKLSKMARTTGMMSRMFNSTLKDKATREREEQEVLSQNEGVDHPESVVQQNAKRGWRIIKRYVNKQATDNKLQGANLKWTMLSHTIRQMTNTYRTRQDLYERYGIIPTKLPDGRVVCENLMLSERARTQIYGDGKESQTPEPSSCVKRPSIYQPQQFHLRSRSQLNFQQYGHKRANTKSALSSHFSGGKLRVKSAK